MIETRLDTILTERGFSKMNSNASGIYFYYRPDERSNAGEDSRLWMISVIHAIDGNELSREQYGHILKKMKSSIAGSNSYDIELLSLVLTTSPENARRLCTDQPVDNHWIIDLSALRLMLYENPFAGNDLSEELQEFRNKIEGLLEEEYISRQEQRYSETELRTSMEDPSLHHPVRRINKVLSPVNTCIILLNVLAFIITYFIPAFGGTDRTLAAGALSWYAVIKEGEYYRILTSMFLHAGVSHLFNNMLVLFFVGYHLEHAVGKLKYLIIYMGGGILAGMASIGYNMWEEYGRLTDKTTISVGASGAIFGVVGAMLLIVIVNRGRLEELRTEQMLTFVLLSLYNGIVNSRIDQAAHVGGFLAGVVLAVLIYRKPTKNISGGEITT
jgi:rhomboid protease GluP